MPLSRVSKAASPGLDEAHKLMDHYFRFAMPTFRFFHRQSLERWMADYVHRQPLPAAKAASVLIVWAQALISYPDDSIGDLQASQRGASYFEQARTLLNSELGPMTLACVEARLAMCLYLLCVSRIVECRFLFSFTHALAISMGLHRKASRRLKLAAFQQERRKRVFWSLYIVDSYLSVMLGQPRHLRDDDLDQEYPVNIDDLVLDAATDLSQVPHHGNIEAFIYHARLARLFTRSTDVLYPIHDISSEDIVQRGESIVAALDGLEQELPTFLKPRLTAAIGVQTWDRQNSVLSLGFAHARIIATRRSLLVDTFKISSDTEMHQRHESCMRDCLDAIINVLDHVFSMLQHGRLLSTFWLTQYIALCAISTLFVYQIQQNQGKVPVLAQSRDLTQYLSKAQEIQEHLAKIVPQGSQAQRHHYLLSKLRQRASRSASSSVTPVEGRAQQSSRVQEEEERYPPSPQPQTQPPVDMPGGNDFTAVNMFDHDIPDAASWLYLDQLGMQPDFHATWPRY
ncbi:uncharacterized protein HMPREF1541_07072 [Cyphellophora europaea CBS 101466]|uniref:Xylanolytic transcriptional activator regulatory domain-containing protein n=1 Tax=Cyphellophora europaea (strain CBS 101466) TaxID=1220924 RepID=W2RRT9_CYPE1|nr:uncharacterized protein HMPREF1541_07072 [Cyphellophora europaea CBS 101466]ETN39030.1 hypothetical protein HMPREF1541_07072 [Cyphellophora europaea CBS 101466]